MILFRLEQTVSDLLLPPDEELNFEFGSSRTLTVNLRPPSRAEQEIGISSREALCSSRLSKEPGERVLQVFERIAANQILDPSSEADREKIALRYNGPDGTQIILPDPSLFPQNFQSFLSSVRKELNEAADRTVAVLRWRFNLQGPHQPMGSRGFYWSFNGQFWHNAPQETFLSITVLNRFRMPIEHQGDILSTIETGDSEPLYHDLFREAWEQRHDRPRSSLLIGVSAAEIAVKTCIATLVPNAEWLASNVPSPPIVRILEEYLPLLPAKCTINGKVLSPPKKIIDDLKVAVQMRNRLVHVGGKDPDLDRVELLLESIRDLLWLIDYYRGYSWAYQYIRADTRAAMEIQ